CQKYSNTPFSF
nr:immunoglobulin light chain junction region [Macaca mulatta]